MSRPRQSEGIKDSLSSSITDVHNDHSANIACSSPSFPVSAIFGENQSNKTESIMKLNKTAEMCTPRPPEVFSQTQLTCESEPLLPRTTGRIYMSAHIFLL